VTRRAVPVRRLVSKVHIVVAGSLPYRFLIHLRHLQHQKSERDGLDRANDATTEF